MNQVYQTVIFDFDGTIADTLPLSVELANRIADELKRPHLGPLEQLRGMTAKQFISTLQLPLHKVFGYARRIQRELKENVEKIPTFPQMQDIIEALKAKNIRVGIISSNQKATVEAFMNHNKLSFDFIHTEPSLFGKHHKIRRVLKKYSLKPAETLYVGDEIRDIEACNKLKLPMGAVSWGYNTSASLQAHFPTHFFGTPESILRAVF
ncbi:MAG: HAD-IA family hydrolase [Candidatus Woesearchaeota archaeon]